MQFLLHALSDPDLLFDYTPSQVERMRRELAELEAEADHDKAEGMT